MLIEYILRNRQKLDGRKCKEPINLIQVKEKSLEEKKLFENKIGKMFIKRCISKERKQSRLKSLLCYYNSSDFWPNFAQGDDIIRNEIFESVSKIVNTR